METKLTEETLQAIEDCGAAKMPISETLEIAEMTEADWSAHPEAAKRYKKGQLKTKMAIRQAIVKGARSGNPALLKAYQEFDEESRETVEPRRSAKTATDSAEAEHDNLDTIERWLRQEPK